MATVRNLTTVALLIVIVQGLILQDNVTSAEEEDFYLLPRQVVPVHYDIRLTPHIVENNFTSNGETWIDVRVLEPTDVVVLHFLQLTIDESQTKITRKNGHDEEHSILHYVPKLHDYRNETDMLIMRFDEPLDTGRYTLYLKFIGIIPFSERGFYRSFYRDKEGNKV